MAQQLVVASKQQRWLDLVRQWEASKLSVRAFCQRFRLREPSFYFWRRSLRELGLLPEAAQPAPRQAEAAFVRVAVDAGDTVPASIEVILAHNRRVHVHVGFDADTLRRLLRVLEEPAY
jgi:transposase-like protein